jgi:DNA-binding LytR/AlgR family response regulator
MEENDENLIKPVILKTPLGYDYFDYDEIIMIKAEGNCSLVFILESETPVRILYNLAFIMKNFNNKVLYRCHKSYIINLTHIEKLVIKTRQVILKNNLVVPLSGCCLRRLRGISKIGRN